MNTLKLAELPALFEAVGAKMSEKADELCAMDAKMGDGDLGLTMKKGFCALPDILRALDEPDIGKLLMKGGMKLASAVPSTMGTLMASGLMAGGKAVSGRTELNASDFAAFLTGFCEGVAKRGKCARGDRTLLDAVGTAADAAQAQLQKDPESGLPDVARAAADGARAGLEATRSMQPKFGKAAVHKAAAQGELDQGACAGAYLIEAMAGYICGAD